MKTLLTSVLVTVLMLAVVPTADAQANQAAEKKKQQRVAKIEKQLERKLCAWSTEQARQVAAKLPADSTEALIAEGRVLSQEKKHGEAIKALEQAVKAAKGDPEPLVHLGEARLAAGKRGPANQAFRQALAHADKQLAKQPDNAWNHYYRGVALQRLRKFDAAIAALEHSRELDGKNPLTVYQLGATHAFMEQWKPAVDLLDRAIEMDSGIAYAYYYRGMSAGKLKRMDLLINDLDRFVALAPEAPEADSARRILASVR
ncbi:MAG: CDC27 family protein [Acidobacteriota bacterium]